MTKEKVFELDAVEVKEKERYAQGEVIVAALEIQRRIGEVAKTIAKKYKGEHLVLIGLLKGGAFSTVWLANALHEAGLTDVDVQFANVSSYDEATESSGKVRINYDVPKGHVKDKKVLLVDDIHDSGLTVADYRNRIKRRGAESVESFALAFKKAPKATRYIPEYIGFLVPGHWLGGAGMDSLEGYRGRSNPNIFVEKNLPKQKNVFTYKGHK